MANAYLELMKKHQNEINNFPLGFCFGNEQYEDMMAKWNLDPVKDKNKIYSLGYGAYVRKEDASAFHDMLVRHNEELMALRNNIKEMEDAFYYEMCNHEYGINEQGDWDVLNCFAKHELTYRGNELYGSEERLEYFNELGFTNELIGAYYTAMSRYEKDSLANDWF